VNEPCQLDRQPRERRMHGRMICWLLLWLVMAVLLGCGKSSPGDRSEYFPPNRFPKKGILPKKDEVKEDKKDEVKKDEVKKNEAKKDETKKGKGKAKTPESKSNTPS
jgi:hypothetical protein